MMAFKPISQCSLHRPSFSTFKKIVHSWSTIPNNLILKMHPFCLGYSILEDTCHVFQVITISIADLQGSAPNSINEKRKTRSDRWVWLIILYRKHRTFWTHFHIPSVRVNIFAGTREPLRDGNGNNENKGDSTRRLLDTWHKTLSRNYRLTIQRKPVTPKRWLVIERPHQDRSTQIAQSYRRSLLSYRPPGSKAI